MVPQHPAIHLQVGIEVDSTSFEPRGDQHSCASGFNAPGNHCGIFWSDVCGQPAGARHDAEQVIELGPSGPVP